jgi:hypothetical protein
MGTEAAGTSYFGVIDKHGNILSCTPSEGAKSGPIIPGTGLALSLRRSQSKVEPGHLVAVGPGKRPRLTPAPALVLKDGQPVMALGGYGGDHAAAWASRRSSAGLVRGRLPVRHDHPASAERRAPGRGRSAGRGRRSWLLAGVLWARLGGRITWPLTLDGATLPR